MKKEIDTFRITIPDPPGFDEVIDVRAPVEFEADHISGAVNLPVLWNQEREQIGKRYKQQSAFEAKKAGAALVSKNIQRHLDGHFAEKPEDYRALIYCFRGGQRSRSLATILAEIGWEVAVIEGGYKAYRKQVIESLDEKSAALRFQVVNGLTGTGKTHILEALESLGAQIIDLEALARHKGSVFGDDPDHPQPTQKRFESLIFDHLVRFDPSRPVYIEAESPKIGRLNLPMPLRRKLGESPVVEIISSQESRIRHILDDYESWLADPERVIETIERLRPFHSGATIERWQNWCREGRWPDLIGELLTEHYDQHYGADGKGNYAIPEKRLQLEDQSPESIRRCAEELLGSDLVAQQG